MPAILAGPTVGQDIIRHCGQSQSVVKFVVGQQAGLRCDVGTEDLQFQVAVENGPKGAAIRFTPGPPSEPPTNYHKTMILIQYSD